MLGRHFTYYTQGVPQGFLTSPLLFNLITLSLIDELKEGGITCCLFADDIAVICNGIKEVDPAH